MDPLRANAVAGHADRAAWLVEREHALRSDDVEAQIGARMELSRVVLGMGGLTDLYYGSPGEQQRVGQLIDEMWAVVKPWSHPDRPGMPTSAFS